MIIRFEDISKVYANGRGGRRVQAVQDVSLSVEAGEFLCMLGPSGCGKSTLLNLAAGFERPTAGRILFEGEAVAGPGPERGVVFQDAALFPWLTARQNVEFGLRAARVPAAARRERALDGLELVGLSGAADARPHELSGGMRQRVAIARVLVMNPRALLMDEPFGALDANTRERLQDVLLGIWDARRLTVLFVTHNVREAAYLADRVAVMGPPPQSLLACVDTSLSRPREREDRRLTDKVEMLREALSHAPCCVAPGGDVPAPADVNP